MPELPEVETTRRGILPHLEGQQVTGLRISERRLRWPLPEALEHELPGQIIETVNRRGKYLLLPTRAGTLIAHLGMSGNLRLVPVGTPPRRHEHVDLELGSGMALRYTDPRCFGCLLWCQEPLQHALLRDLGPEPLEADFDGTYLFERSRGRELPVKNFIMDAHVVVGVGNIYASEALFRSGIDPRRAAGSISKARYQRLAAAIGAILSYAITRGGTTLRDFVGGDGQPGYFQQELDVYGRAGQPCKACGTVLQQVRLGQRASVYCPRCQR